MLMPRTYWDLGIGGFIEAHRFDHVAATLVGGHRLKEFPPAIEDADAGGAEHFMAAEGIKIDIQFLHIGWAVGDPLSKPSRRTRRAGGVGFFDDADRRD